MTLPAFTVSSLMVMLAATGGFIQGYRYGWMEPRTDASEVSVRVMPGEQTHDNAAGPLDGFMALGIASSAEGLERRPWVGSVGDYAALRVDQQTGAILAKCLPFDVAAKARE